jgi:hypothetical protein
MTAVITGHFFCHIDSDLSLSITRAIACWQVAVGDPAAMQSYSLALSMWREKGSRAGEAAVLMQARMRRSSGQRSLYCQ